MLFTNASTFALDSILSQKNNDGNEHVVTYTQPFVIASRKELLSDLIEIFGHYLGHRKVSPISA